jgi:hypothetical protein
MYSQMADTTTLSQLETMSTFPTVSNQRYYV